MILVLSHQQPSSGSKHSIYEKGITIDKQTINLDYTIKT